MRYEINILPEPEIFNGNPMFFWCVFGVSGDNRCNCGYGWAESVEKAATDAYNHYSVLIGESKDE